jgi:cation-transporting P-type ATPase A/B
VTYATDVVSEQLGVVVTTATVPDKEVTQRIALDVTGMSCGACAARVENKLNKVDGVRASVNFATRVATVEADPDIGVEQLCAVIERAGYQAAPRTERSTTDIDPDAEFPGVIE